MDNAQSHTSSVQPRIPAPARQSHIHTMVRFGAEATRGLRSEPRKGIEDVRGSFEGRACQARSRDTEWPLGGKQDSQEGSQGGLATVLTTSPDIPIMSHSTYCGSSKMYSSTRRSEGSTLPCIRVSIFDVLAGLSSHGKRLQLLLHPCRC